jgi:hypothetical protein
MKAHWIHNSLFLLAATGIGWSFWNLWVIYMELLEVQALIQNLAG